MSDLKNSWKGTGKELGHAFKGLGKNIINSGKKGVDKAVDWAGREDPQGTAPQGYVEASASAAPKNNTGYSAADEIEKLARLRDQGLISQQEFEEKKKQILGL